MNMNTEQKKMEAVKAVTCTRKILDKFEVMPDANEYSSVSTKNLC